MQNWANYIGAIGGLLGMLIMWAAQVPPHQAVSHASQWAHAFGWHRQPHWMKSENADYVVRHMGAGLLAGCILFVAFGLFGIEEANLGVKVAFGIGCATIIGAIVWHLFFPTVELAPTYFIIAGLVVALGAAIWQLCQSAALSPAAPSSSSLTWILPKTAVEKFVSPEVIAAWKTDPSVSSRAYQRAAEDLRQLLLAGNLIGRGTPHYGSAGDAAVIIPTAEWQSLRIGGPDFSGTGSSAGPAHSYDNLEIAAKPGFATSEPSAKVQEPILPKKYYSSDDKEKLSNLYGQLSELLIANGGDGGGDGAYAKITAFGNEWNRQQSGFFNSGGTQFDVKLLQVKLQAARDATVEMYKALYGYNGIAKKREFLIYHEEINSILQDDSGKKIEEIQVSLNGVGRIIAALSRPAVQSDKGSIENIIMATQQTITDFQNGISRFQRWEFEANQRAVKSRGAL